MEQTTIAALLDRTLSTVPGHLIYVVRDGDLVLYVGQSKRDVVTRFWEHVNAPSRLGRLIAANRPESADWVVEFYTLADCQPFIPQKTLFPVQGWEHFDMDMAEQALIRQMRPVVNRDFNPEPTTLPAHYRGHAVLDETPIFEFLFTPRYRLWLNRMSLHGWVYERDEEFGRITWRHRDGVALSDEDVAAYREANRLPPTRE